MKAALALLATVLAPAGGLRAEGPVDALLRAYPEALAGFEGGALVWRDGTRMEVGAAAGDRPMREQLRDGTILEQLRLAYKSGPLASPTDDPGRIRNRAFFDKMYGDCHAGEVAPKLARVVWLPRSWGHSVSITTVNRVDRHLAAVSRELDALPAEDKGFLYPPAGTYKCRNVADLGQPSMHGWGAAIDINAARSDYWLWHRQAGDPPAYVNRIPAEIVTIFERHGFIWGGRWAHFDTMHFEYRPELLGTNPAADE